MTLVLWMTHAFVYAYAQVGCSDLDWARLDSRDAVQLCRSKARFTDAVQGTYNMQGKVTLDSRFAKCGFKSPRIRGGTCLLELKILARDLPSHGPGQTAPDTVCQVLIFNLGSRRWQKEWESDIQMREHSPTYRRVLRVEIPDGGNTHAIILILDKSRRGSAEIGRAAVNLDQVLDACEQTSMTMPAYVHRLCPPCTPEVSNETWCNGVIDDAVGEREASAGEESTGTLVLRAERMEDGAHLSVSLRGADPEGLDADTTTHSSTFVPKFQRAVMQMTGFALSLFDQFKLLQARGEIDDADRHKPHTLDEAQFLNLLVGIVGRSLCERQRGGNSALDVADLRDRGRGRAGKRRRNRDAEHLLPQRRQQRLVRRARDQATERGERREAVAAAVRVVVAQDGADRETLSQGNERMKNNRVHVFRDGKVVVRRGARVIEGAHALDIRRAKGAIEAHEEELAVLLAGRPFE